MAEAVANLLIWNPDYLSRLAAVSIHTLASYLITDTCASIKYIWFSNMPSIEFQVPFEYSTVQPLVVRAGTWHRKPSGDVWRAPWLMSWLMAVLIFQTKYRTLAGWSLPKRTCSDNRGSTVHSSVILTYSYCVHVIGLTVLAPRIPHSSLSCFQLSLYCFCLWIFTCCAHTLPDAFFFPFLLLLFFSLLCLVSAAFLML